MRSASTNVSGVTVTALLSPVISTCVTPGLGPGACIGESKKTSKITSFRLMLVLFVIDCGSCKLTAGLVLSTGMTNNKGSLFVFPAVSATLPTGIVSPIRSLIDAMETENWYFVLGSGVNTPSTGIGIISNIVTAVGSEALC